MTKAEVCALLAIAMAYDNRKSGDAQTLAWQEQATRCRWTFEEAREAIHEHYRASTEFLMPAHITRYIQAERQHRAPVPQLGAAEPAPPQRVRQVLDELAAKLGWPAQPTSGASSATLPVECPHCLAGPGRPCTRTAFGGAHDGELVPLPEPHPSRRDLAGGTA